MKKINLFAVIALTGLVMFSSCSKKKDDPAPVIQAPAGSVGVTGSFKVNEATQTPTIATRNVNTEFGITFTQVIVQNANYSLNLEFSNSTLENGEYKIQNLNPSSTNREVSVTLTDLKTKEFYMSSGEISEMVKVKDGNISFSKFTIKTIPMIEISGNYTIK